jgi:hypothetical protein
MGFGFQQFQNLRMSARPAPGRTSPKSRFSFILQQISKCRFIFSPFSITTIFGGQWMEWRIVSSGMLRRVALVRTDVPEELSTSFIRVTRIGELGTTLAVTSNRCTLQRNTTLMKEAQGSSERSDLTRVTRRNITEDNILHSHRRGNLKSYTVDGMFEIRSPVSCTSPLLISFLTLIVLSCTAPF